MKANNHGHIVAVSCFGGLKGFANCSTYCASKFAVCGLMESLYEEFRKDPNCRIKCTTVCPYPFAESNGWFGRYFLRVSPKYLAKQIVKAQRMGVVTMTVPRFLLNWNHFTR